MDDDEEDEDSGENDAGLDEVDDKTRLDQQCTSVKFDTMQVTEVLATILVAPSCDGGHRSSLGFAPDPKHRRETDRSGHLIALKLWRRINIARQFRTGTFFALPISNVYFLSPG